jgi:hypothetical protein
MSKDGMYVFYLNSEQLRWQIFEKRIGGRTKYRMREINRRI